MYFRGVQQGWLFKDSVRIFTGHTIVYDAGHWDVEQPRGAAESHSQCQEACSFFLFWTSSFIFIYNGERRFESWLFFRFQMKREEVRNVATPWREQLSHTGLIVRTLYSWRPTPYWLRARQSRVRIQVGARVFLFSKIIQTGSAAYRPPLQCVSCLFPRVKWPVPEFDHSLPIQCQRKE